MEKVIIFAMRLLVKCALWLRYRVRVKGLEEITERGTTGILFLPNHPAYIDPFIVLSRLSRDFAPRFLADKDQIDRLLVRRLAARAGALPIPDASRYHGAAEEIEKALSKGIEALKSGENFLFYPAGQATYSRFEDLGGKSALEKILHEAPDARVVLVRTRGLWGSMFSRAGGPHIDVKRSVSKAVWSLLANGIFFSPRRSVTIELVEPSDLPRGADRTALNRYLEAFYNQDAPPNTYVPYTLWESGGVRTVEEPPARAATQTAQVPAQVRATVTEHLVELTGRRPVADKELLGRDLGLDSLSIAELAAWLEGEFALAHLDVHTLLSVGDVMAAAAGQTVRAAAVEVKQPPEEWFEPLDLYGVTGETITQAFLYQVERSPSRLIAADQISGAKTYRDLATAVYALSGVLRGLPGEYLGIMLPASVAADTLYLAALFAGKIPVMVNWTVGARHMSHSLELLGVEAVVTAKVFAERVEFQLGDLGAVKERFVFVEDLARRISLVRKVAAKTAAPALLARLVRGGKDETAVVLFTSGSETLPKAVPLTHANILADIRDVLSVVTLERDERFVGLFPPFHSFGLTCTVILPLVAGAPVFHHPNPTEGAAIARLIELYEGTMLLGTPTFLSGILRGAEEGQLDSLRLVVSGAEKCGEAVYEAFQRHCPYATILEGYGISECSPVISVNDENDPKAFTVGKALPSLEYAIVHPETFERVGRGETGMLLVRGPSVFGGYLNYDGPSPFVEFEGKRWYRTGDLVVEDEDGVLSFAGRLKRFIKLGGEMISLPAIEAALERHWPPTDDGPRVAVEATGGDENPEVVLFATVELDRAEVNDRIRGEGLSALHSVRRVVRIEEIPLLGSGKTNYRALKERL